MITIPDDILALIFDCDGTLADTMPAHYRAWVSAVGVHGVDFPEDLFYSFGGMPTSQIINNLNDLHGTSMPVHETAQQKEALFEQMIPAVRPVVAVVEIARANAGRRPMGVATGGQRHICEATLRQLGIIDLFDAIVTSEDVTHGKPSPDIFLEAARRLNVNPKNCLAFEDADPGLQSARSAGMRVIDVRKLEESYF